MDYQRLRYFCSKNRKEIEELVGHPIRCQDKADMLLSYYNAVRDRPSESTVSILTNRLLRYSAKRPDVIIDKRFILGPLLGQGGFGLVYEAENSENQKRVAVKISFTAQARQQLSDEIKIISLLQDLPGIPRLIVESLVETKDYSAMVSQLLGPSVKKARVTISNLSTCATQMLETIQAIHKQGIIHRDVTLPIYSSLEESNQDCT